MCLKNRKPHLISWEINWNFQFSYWNNIINKYYLCMLYLISSSDQKKINGRTITLRIRIMKRNLKNIQMNNYFISMYE
jgi:hypothetical protein